MCIIANLVYQLIIDIVACFLLFISYANQGFRLSMGGEWGHCPLAFEPLDAHILSI